MRKGQLLRIKMEDLNEVGISSIPAIKGINSGRKKRKPRPVTYEWTDETRAIVKELTEARPVDISPYLICNKYGKGYFQDQIKPEGWNSMWQRFMTRVLKETKVDERFTEHDLRAKCASDAGSTKQAQQLLSHADARITERVYRRKPEIIRPLK